MATRFPSLWAVAYAGQPTKPSEVTYEQFVSAVAEKLKNDPTFVNLSKGGSGERGFAGDGKTSTTIGATFTNVLYDGFAKHGRALQDASGVIWSVPLPGKYSNEGSYDQASHLVTDSPALTACKNIGGDLPTQDDFIRLRSYFEGNEPNRLSYFYVLTKNGLMDLYSVFPDMRDKIFWSKSTYADGVPSSNGTVSVFNVLATPYHYVIRYGDVGEFQNRSNLNSVICVKR